MAADANTIAAVEAALKTRLQTISGLLVYDYEPRDLDSLPAITFGVPSLTRIDLDAAEFEVGSTEWKLFWPLRIYITLDDPKQAQDDAKALLGQIVGVIDADQTLGSAAGVRDAKLVSADIAYTAEGESKQMAIWTCSLGVWLFVSY